MEYGFLPRTPFSGGTRRILVFLQSMTFSADPPPPIHGIEERLKRARSIFIGNGTLSDSFQIERAAKDTFERHGEWLATVPEFANVRDWIRVHWDPGRETQRPSGTVRTGGMTGCQGEVRLDAPLAACKLILSGGTFGIEKVAEHAARFAAHDMIETYSIHLLKGSSLSGPVRLDHHCVLLPYRDALARIAAQPLRVRPSGREPRWPPADAGNVCALEARSFERRSLDADKAERYKSRLMQCGLERLVLLLGLVWGRGLRLFGHYHSVLEPVAATLPFFGLQSRGEGTSQAMFPLLEGSGIVRIRPVAVSELMSQVEAFAQLPPLERKRLSLALRRLRDSVERTGLEDRAIDLSIALEALFMEEGKKWNHNKLIQRRGSWHYADSSRERERTRKRLKQFYDYRSSVIHGNAPANLTPEEQECRHRLLMDTENVIRASAKTMILEGRPPDWRASEAAGSIRQDPQLSDTDIRSVKSDSLSWSVREQKEIDRALERVWKREVEAAPPPRPGPTLDCYLGVNAEETKRCREQGIPYTIRIPARLYMVHPMWPQQAGEVPDERTKYYCYRDVETHMQRWMNAANEKKLCQFELPLENDETYFPENFSFWRKLLRRAESDQPVP